MGKERTNRTEIIARAIKRADKWLVFENYTAQAKAVIKALEKEGYAVVPIEPTEEMVKRASDEMKLGRTRPERHVQDVWQCVIRSLK